MTYEEAILCVLVDGKPRVGHDLLLEISYTLGGIDRFMFERTLEEMTASNDIKVISPDGRPVEHAAVLTLCTMPLYRYYETAHLVTIVPKRVTRMPWRPRLRYQPPNARRL